MQKLQGLTVPINFELSILLKDKTIPETSLRQSVLPKGEHSRAGLLCVLFSSDLKNSRIKPSVFKLKDAWSLYEIATFIPINYDLQKVIVTKKGGRI